MGLILEDNVVFGVFIGCLTKETKICTVHVNCSNFIGEHRISGEGEQPNGQLNLTGYTKKGFVINRIL